MGIDEHYTSELTGDLPGETTEQWREWALVYMDSDFNGGLLGQWLNRWLEDEE